jgi:predicted ATP-binding protein involved in virulence
MANTPETSEIYNKVITLLKEARGAVVRTVNQTMVLTYYEIGRIIVEEEQKGQDKAQYGKAVISELSKKLTKEFGKGFSKRNIEQMRQFYLAY